MVDPVDVKPKARVLPPGIKSNGLTLYGEPYAFVDVERGIQGVDLGLGPPGPSLPPGRSLLFFCAVHTLV